MIGLQNSAKVYILYIYNKNKYNIADEEGEA